MISIPDDLLKRLDAQASANRETRSGFLRRLVERELKVDETERREELEGLLSPSLPTGVNWVKLIRDDRESH
jgi:metal-responsive CopG/Arc/MetJ family transcriptional regulator